MLLISGEYRVRYTRKHLLSGGKLACANKDFSLSGRAAKNMIADMELKNEKSFHAQHILKYTFRKMELSVTWRGRNCRLS